MTTDEECCETMQETSKISKRSVPVPIKKVYLQCEHCKFKSSWKIAIKFHLKTHHKMGSGVKCAICLKWSNDINSFKLHQCGFITSETREIRSKSSHATLQKFSCQKCPAMYTSQRLLNRHIAAHKEPNYKPGSVLNLHDHTVHESKLTIYFIPPETLTFFYRQFSVLLFLQQVIRKCSNFETTQQNSQITCRPDKMYF